MKAKMRILHIITGLGDGGAEGALSRLIIHDSSFEHVVISLMDKGKYGSILETSGVKVFTLDLLNRKVKISKIIELIRIIRKVKPDVIQTWMYHADLLGGICGKVAGVKKIFWGIRHSTLNPKESKTRTIFISKICAKLSYFIPNKIVSCSEVGMKHHVSIGYAKAKFIVIPNGYDFSQFCKLQKDLNLSNQLGLKSNIATLGLVARFNPQKDHFNLLNACSLLKKSKILFRLILIGNELDSNNQELTDKINSLNIKNEVLLLGQKQDIPRFMNLMDIHVLSSKYGEAFPNVVAESMACGVPNVSTNVGDAREIISDTGWICPPSQPYELFLNLKEAIDEFENGILEKRAFKALERVNSLYSIEKMVTNYHASWSS